MADIRPFRGIRYNPKLSENLSALICPPFDTISSEMQDSLHEQHPYNIIRLELGENRPNDTNEYNRYSRSALLLNQWIKEGILLREVNPSFYIVSHKFVFNGKTHDRLELIATVRLTDYDKRVVLPHEYTKDNDKQDRFDLIKACRANFSPIMCLYQDDRQHIRQVILEAMSKDPLVEFEDSVKQRYTVWNIDEGHLIAELQNAMLDKRLYIADGHHRYETALKYLNARINSPSEADLNEAFVMMGLIEFKDPGLTVLPYHRLIYGLSQDQIDNIFDKLGSIFEHVPHECPVGQIDQLQELINKRVNEPTLGVILPTGLAQLFTIRGTNYESDWGLMGTSEAWILQEKILNPVLGQSLKDHINYVHDNSTFSERLENSKGQIGFLMRPFPLDDFKRITDSGKRLPPKSTFFYPKLSTGIVINKFLD